MWVKEGQKDANELMLEVELKKNATDLWRILVSAPQPHKGTSGGTSAAEERWNADIPPRPTVWLVLTYFFYTKTDATNSEATQNWNLFKCFQFQSG